MANKLDFPVNKAPLDLIVIGGGINGAGIANEAASRGLNVGLYEAKDFAVATSSASSKLIHGGLRYLEQYHFRLVKEALAEREILLNKAAHLVRPMRFRLPHQAAQRPAWLVKLGLFLYDHLARRSILPASHTVYLASKDGLHPNITQAFEYSDCWVDDARLVITNIKSANQLGAEVRNYCPVLKVSRENDLWHVALFDERTKRHINRYCRAIVNATGPWAEAFLNQASPESSQHTMRLVKGSHLIVPKLYDDDCAYILQNHDKRVVFVIPYLQRFSMIGTTDIPYQGDPYQASASSQEIEYLLDVTNRHFRQQLSAQDIISSFSGVRPLFGDSDASAQQISRDYELVLQQQNSQLPILTVYGGKLTTYRKLAAKAIDQLTPFFPHTAPSLSAISVFSEAIGFDAPLLIKQVAQYYPDFTQETVQRLVDLYGTDVWEIIRQINDPNQPLTNSVYQAEIDYLINNEWAMTDDDILSRRTKLCYLLTPPEQQLLRKSLGNRL